MTWITPYATPSVTGVTAGTISVPTLIPQDWALAKSEVGKNRYISANANGGYIELDVASSTVSTPYGQSKVAANEAIVGLVGQSAYIRVRAFGSVQSACEGDCTDGQLAPVSVAINVTTPSGVTITNEQLQELVGIAVSGLSDVVTEGTVVPLSHVPEIALGAINIR